MPYITFKDRPRKSYKCSMRLIRICKDNRIYRLSDFTRMTFRESLSLPECGQTTARVVQKILHDIGLDFHTQPAGSGSGYTGATRNLFHQRTEVTAGKQRGDGAPSQSSSG